MIVDDYTYRNFQVWEYKVSLGQLLIRSPMNSSYNTNIDLIFMGVDYMELPRFLKGIKFKPPTATNINHIENILKKPIENNTYILFSNGSEFIVVANSFKISENEMDIFDSHF